MIRRAGLWSRMMQVAVAGSLAAGAVLGVATFSRAPSKVDVRLDLGDLRSRARELHELASQAERARLTATYRREQAHQLRDDMDALERHFAQASEVAAEAIEARTLAQSLSRDAGVLAERSILPAALVSVRQATLQAASRLDALEKRLKRD